jgi:CheY-like chemotaxis protein
MNSGISAKNLRLLVVEDDSALREEITRILERRTSYDFDTAENAEKAIEMFEDHLMTL